MRQPIFSVLSTMDYTKSNRLETFVERHRADFDLHEPRAAFDEPPRQQQSISKTISVVVSGFELFFRFNFRLIRREDFRLFVFRKIERAFHR